MQIYIQNIIFSYFKRRQTFFVCAFQPETFTDILRYHIAQKIKKGTNKCHPMNPDR